MSQTFEDAAKGVAAGAVLGPIGMAAGGVIGALTDLLPSLATSILGKKGGDVAAAAVQLASAATGKADPTPADVQGLAPADQAALRLQLAQLAAKAEQDQRDDELEAMKASLADVQSARGQTLALAQAKSAIAWGAPVISAIVVVGFFAVLYVTLEKPLPAGDETIINMLMGVLSAAFGGVVNYWIGSSSGSAMKTEHLAASVPASFAAAQAAKK
jgi:hypothetical protein